MQFVIFILLYPILWLISILPFRLLYLLSDFIYFILYRVIKYRKKIVRYNLSIALPHLTQAERIEIEKKFFKHLCDLFLEMIKTLTISRSTIEKRFTFKNLELYQDLEKEGKSIALMCAHYASYEWVMSMNFYINHKGFGIYKKIHNPYFDKLVKNIRSKFKANLITTRETAKVIEYNYNNNILALYGFASDQTPKWSDHLYWYHFMGIETPIHTGAEALAKKYDMNVIFLKTKKIKRGYYEASFELLSDNVKQVPDFKISEQFTRLVEQQIQEQPEYYLWSHKRWKHKKQQ